MKLNKFDKVVIYITDNFNEEIKEIDISKYNTIYDILELLNYVKTNIQSLIICLNKTTIKCFKYDTNSKNLELIPYLDKNILDIFENYFALDKIPLKLYHKSNPIFRKQILKNGLIPNIGDSYKSHYDFYDNLSPAIFLSKNDDYDTTYDDDIYLINTKLLDKNKFIKDYDVKNALIYLDNIYPNSIELIYKGTGKSLF